MDSKDEFKFSKKRTKADGDDEGSWCSNYSSQMTHKFGEIFYR